MKSIYSIVKLFLFIPFFLLSLTLFAQTSKVKRYLEVGVSPISYKGDLSQGYKKWNSAFHLGIKNNRKKRLNGHFNFMAGKIVGQNPDYTFPDATPNQFFSTSIFSLNFDLQFNLIKKDNFILYISQGIGLLRFKAKDDNNNDLSEQFPSRAKNETYNNIALFLPHSIGMMYFLPNNYGFGIQMGRLVPTTDYLDNISKLSTYKKPDNLLMIKFSLIVPIEYKEEATK